MSTVEFNGPERRRHKLFITRNSEYHVRDGRVIAVRERRRRCWLLDHRAIGMRVLGRLRGDTIAPTPSEPEVGDRMYLADGDERSPKDLVTSLVLAVERPPREVVAEYASVAA